MRSVFDLEATELSAGRIQVGDVVPRLPNEPDFAICSDVGIAWPCVRPRHFPLGDAEGSESLRLLRTDNGDITRKRNERGTNNERTKKRNGHRTTSDWILTQLMGGICATPVGPCASACSRR